jgi:hypothetical protein
MLGMSRSSREPAKWALTHAPCDLGRRRVPILDELGPKAITTVQII